ncbi:hypothetical protein HDV04_002754 [Boothiomyces sp. JEL0838]|nr:hypothetical protein HDV04_002754 [Boothiomyces sp. JEL0838]
MKHGVRFWQKKLGRKPNHRLSLQSNLLAELVDHEQIQTTTAKAKFIKHEMEKIINMAKKGAPKDLEYISSKLNGNNKIVPKVMHLLAKRYQDRNSGYVRILKNGYRGNGSDRAALSIIELVNNPNDIVYSMAKNNLSVLKEKLDSIEALKYKKTVLKLKDLSSGEPTEFVNLEDRHDITGRERKIASAKERSAHKVVAKYERVLKSYPEARNADEQAIEKLKEMIENKAYPKDLLDGFVQPVKAEMKIQELEEPVEVKEVVVEKAPEPSKSFMEKYFGRFMKK